MKHVQHKANHRDPEGTGQGMEPFLLLELAAGPSHGYELAQSMADLGFRRAGEDPSVVYRQLRSLNEQGRLAAEWTVGDRGSRRVYHLTPAGEAYLHERAGDLERQARRIGTFLEHYGQRFTPGEAATRKDA